MNALKMFALAGFCAALISGTAQAECLQDDAAVSAGQYSTANCPTITQYEHVGKAKNVKDDGTQSLPVYTANELPPGAVAAGVSAAGANATQTATMAAVSAKKNYACQVTFTGVGSTSGLAVAPTITGLAGGTRTFAFAFPAGVLVPAQPLVVHFQPCLAGSAVNTAVSAILPAGGSGNTNASADIEGYVR